MDNQNYFNGNRIIFSFCLVLALSFGIYIFTLTPSLSLRDGAELTTAAYSLGVPHSPGYPSFVLSGRIFTNLSLGNVAYRINVMNAFFAALSIALLFFACLLVTGSAVSSTVASLSAALTLNYWIMSTGNEVFSMNVVFLVMLWIITVLFIQGKSGSKIPLIYLFSFISGFGLGNHHLLVAGIFSCGMIFLFEIFRNKIKLNILKIPGFFILGFSVYLFLPIRAAIDPVLNYGDPRTLGNVISVILRRQYGSFTLSPDKSTSHFSPDAGVILWYFNSLISDFTIVIFLCGLAGFFISLKQDKRLNFLFSIQFVLYGLGFILLANMKDSEKTRSIIDRFFHLSYFPFAVFIAYGINKFSITLKKIRFNPVSIVCVFVLIFVFLDRMPVLNLISRNNYFQLEVADNLAKTFKKNSIVLTQADAPQYAILYAYVVENKRQDIIPNSSFLHDWRIKQIERRWPGLIPKGLYQSSKDIERAIIESNIASRPVFLAGGIGDSAARDISDLEKIPAGLAIELVKKSRDTNLLKGFKESSRLMEYIYSIRNSYSTRFYDKSLFIREIISKYAVQHFDIGQGYLQNRQFNQALNEFLVAGSIFPDSPVDSPVIELNIGLAYSMLGSHLDAIKHLRWAIMLKPDFTEAYYTLGLSYLKLNEFEKAGQVFEEAVKLNPDYEGKIKKLLAQKHI